MGLVNSILYVFARFVRDLLDFVTDTVYGHCYSGKQERLPAIKHKCLLEPATVLASKIRRGEIRSVDVVRAYINRIREVNPVVNAVVDERFTEAMEEAAFADELVESNYDSEKLQLEMPFLGVPITVKEAIAVKGCSFTVGLPARKGMKANFDADVVAAFKKAGAIPIAVTITPELCFWWESYNKLYGRCRNPYDTTRTVGGSSGGEGCIISCAGSVIGLANDIGGSIRIPACFNGVFGHKPSRGIVSNKGEYPPAGPVLQTYLMTGPICRYADDLLPMMKVLAGEKGNMLLNLDEPVHFSEMKIYYMEDDGGNPMISSVNPEITKALRRVLSYFNEAYGIIPEKVDIADMKRAFSMWANILTASDMEPVLSEMTGRTGQANWLVEVLKYLFGVSEHILPVVVQGVMNKFMLSRNTEKEAAKYYRMAYDLQQKFEDMLAKDGIFLYPTNPDLPPYHGQALSKPFSVGYTAIFNLLGLPISQCPIGLSDNCLPIGIQVVGGLYNDRLTIAVARELEKAFGGWMCPSVVAATGTI